MREWIACILLASLTPAPLLAARLPLRRYGTQDGLPHNRVNQILRDSHGFLWFCTGNGLSQFDGSTFVTFGADRSLCRSILEDRQGFYWVVSGGEGIYRLDPRTDDPARVLTRYTAPGDSDAAGVDRMVRDRSGTLWAGGARGLFVVEDRGGPGCSVRSLVCGSGRFWWIEAACSG
jgi:ligand-binding sensor domain-containing protein